MKTIFKWDIGSVDAIEIQKGAEILTVQAQHGEARIWALVDPTMEKVKRRFKTYGTGYPVPDKPGVYVGTYQVWGGDLVFHVFEVAL